MDALQIIAHGHVEDESIRVSQPIDPGEHLAGAPGLHILLKGLLDSQLRAPLAVVALVLRQDTGAGNAGGQLRTIHLLNGFQLKKPGTGKVAGDDVLGQLSVGTGGGAEWRLNGFTEDGQLFHPRPIGADAEYGAVPLVFGGDPGHQFPKGNGGHQF